MGKKGLSLEEKRKKMLEILYETKDFFLLKELEKIAPKQKGIIAQSVKDVLQSLVDDNLVDTDKIGTFIMCDQASLSWHQTCTNDTIYTIL